MVSNTSKKCLLALVLFLSLLAPVQVQCADGGKGSSSWKSKVFIVSAGFISGTALAHYCLTSRERELEQDLNKAQTELQDMKKQFEEMQAQANTPEAKK